MAKPSANPSNILTTAAVCTSDETVFINEADIVTFTGTIYLQRHIKEQLALCFWVDHNKPDFHNMIDSETIVMRLNDFITFSGLLGVFSYLLF